MEHISINPELIIEQKSEDVMLHTKNHRYELPRNKFIDLLKKSQDSVMYEEDQCWFPDHKTFDINIEEKKDQATTKTINGEERKYITLISWASNDNTNPRQSYVMSITAANTDGKGWSMRLDIRTHYLFDDGMIRPKKKGIVIPPDGSISLLENRMKIIGNLECNENRPK